ncbi:MAG: hypothetical protein DIU79_00180 [Actinobacteria bacterium]|nr:MAG: hypothetical protein DIU79_00180 [Actinomycetota bacterium]
MNQHTHTVGAVFLTPETEPSSPTAAPGAPAIDDVMTAAHHALAPPVPSLDDYTRDPWTGRPGEPRSVRALYDDLVANKHKKPEEE